MGDLKGREGVGKGGGGWGYVWFFHKKIKHNSPREGGQILKHVGLFDKITMSRYSTYLNFMKGGEQKLVLRTYVSYHEV